MSLLTTPSQTVGPYLHIGLRWSDGPDVVAEGTPHAVVVRGRLFDGAGAPVPDGMIETWQADPEGRFDHPDDPRGRHAHPGFRGFGRCDTDADGGWWVRTLKPGALPLPDGVAGGGAEAPHLDVSVFARGLLNRLVTRIYFADEAAANAADPVLAALPEHRRALLIAEPEPGGYRLDIHLQGELETPFFAV